MRSVLNRVGVSRDRKFGAPRILQGDPVHIALCAIRPAHRGIDISQLPVDRLCQSKEVAARAIDSIGPCFDDGARAEITLSSVWH
jgi:hypothetical protein